MKRDLLIAGLLIAVAGAGIAVVLNLPALQKEDDKPKTIKPKPEPIAELPKKKTPEIKPVEKKTESAINKKVVVKTEPEPKSIAETKIVEKTEPAPKKVEQKTIVAKVEAEPKKIDGKVEPKEEKKPAAVKIIAIGDDLIKLNDPDGEYTVKSLSRGMKLKLIGTIKTLHIVGANGDSVLDATDLVAQAIVFTGHINRSTVLLGQAKSLKVRDLNDGSLLDASALDAQEIQVAGTINSNSTIKLHAPKGTIEFLGEANDRAQIEIVAPEGKVTFKARGESVINGTAKLTILAKDVEFAGVINGPQSQLDVTLTKAGSLKVGRINGGVRFHYRKANAGDPEPRIDMGPVDASAEFRKK